MAVRIDNWAQIVDDVRIGNNCKSQMPCCLPCPKCGNIDIYRRFFEKGQDTNQGGPKRGVKSSDWVDRKDNWMHRAKKDCIVHHCRCCGWEWDGDPMVENTGSAVLNEVVNEDNLDCLVRFCNAIKKTIEEIKLCPDDTIGNEKSNEWQTGLWIDYNTFNAFVGRLEKNMKKQIDVRTCEECGKVASKEITCDNIKTGEPVDYVLLIVSAGVRHWEDASVNGVEDKQGNLIPFRNGDNWEPIIELATGRIRDWPLGKTANIYYKVCDEGEYWLADEVCNKVAKWKGHYVPNDFLCVGEDGYGDYIILKVGKNGQIEGWSPPRICSDEWEYKI